MINQSILVCTGHKPLHTQPLLVCSDADSPCYFWLLAFIGGGKILKVGGQNGRTSLHGWPTGGKKWRATAHPGLPLMLELQAANTKNVNLKTENFVVKYRSHCLSADLNNLHLTWCPVAWRLTISVLRNKRVMHISEIPHWARLILRRETIYR